MSDAILEVKKSADEKRAMAQQEVIRKKVDCRLFVDSVADNILEMASISAIRSIYWVRNNGQPAIICSTNHKAIADALANVFDALSLDYTVQADSYSLKYSKKKRIKKNLFKDVEVVETTNADFVFKLMSSKSVAHADIQYTQSQIDELNKTMNDLGEIFLKDTEVFFEKTDVDYNLVNIGFVDSEVESIVMTDQLHLDYAIALYNTNKSIIAANKELINDDKDETEENEEPETPSKLAKVWTWLKAVPSKVSSALKTVGTKLWPILQFLLKYSIKAAIAITIFVAIWGFPKFI